MTYTCLKANHEHSLVLTLNPGRKSSVRSSFQAVSQDNNSWRTDCFSVTLKQTAFLKQEKPSLCIALC